MGVTSRNVSMTTRVVIHLTLAALRKKKGFTQEELAAALGVSTSAVGNWEAGLRRPRYDTLRRLAEVLGVSLDDLRFPEKSSKEEAENDGN